MSRDMAATHYVYLDWEYRCSKCGSTMYRPMKQVLDYPDTIPVVIICKNSQCENHNLMWRVLRMRVEVEPVYEETADVQ